MISKRAIIAEELLKAIKHLWHINAGPFENIFRLLSYATPLIPGAGWIIFVLNELASFIGYGLENLGKYLDKELNLGSGSNLSEKELEEAGNILINLFENKKESCLNQEIQKFALLGWLFKPNTIKTIKYIWNAIKYILTALGVDQVKDIYTKLKEDPNLQRELFEKGMEKAQEALQSNISDIQNIMET